MHTRWDAEVEKNFRYLSSDFHCLAKLPDSGEEALLRCVGSRGGGAEAAQGRARLEGELRTETWLLRTTDIHLVAGNDSRAAVSTRGGGGVSAVEVIDESGNSARDPPFRYRTFDGRCNNVRHTDWGAAYARLQRFMPAIYPKGQFAIRHRSSAKLQ